MKSKTFLFFAAMALLTVTLLFSACSFGGGSATTTAQTSETTTETPMTTAPTPVTTTAPPATTEAPPTTTEVPPTTTAPPITTEEPPLQADIVFEGATVTYDGTPKSLSATGLPQGATVSYVGNDQINAGTYTVTATFTMPAGYEAVPPIEATLTILPQVLDTAGIRWNYDPSAPYSYSGEEQSVVLILPEKITAVYDGNRATDAGVYTASARLDSSDQNYVLPENYSVPAQSWEIKKVTLDLRNAQWKIVLVSGGKIYDPKYYALSQTEINYESSNEGDSLQISISGVPGVTLEQTVFSFGVYDLSPVFNPDNYILLSDTTYKTKLEYIKRQYTGDIK